MYQDTITLFNRKPGSASTGDVWYPTVIRNVNLNIDRAAILAKYGAESQDNAVLHIRYHKSGESIFVADKPWMPPKQWDRTIDSITIAPGDFFWNGEWEGGITSDSDYVEGFYDWMNKNRDYVFSITSAAMYSVIPHFEVMGR